MKPIVIGLTGNFGSGKSTVARLFQKKGASVLDADKLAHEVFQKKNRLHPKLRSLFPELKGKVTRRRVAEIVFCNSRKRRGLESLIHPYVFRRIRQKLNEAKSRVMILEIPLLFESGFHKHCDRILVVRSPRSEVLKRLGRLGYSQREVGVRWRAQMPLNEKIRFADDVINNSKSLEKTKIQVERLWRKLKGVD